MSFVAYPSLPRCPRSGCLQCPRLPVPMPLGVYFVRSGAVLPRIRAAQERKRKGVGEMAAEGGSNLECLEMTGFVGGARREMSNVGRSSNLLWHDCPIGKVDRQDLLGQKGCVIWITGLSGSGKSTLACTLSRMLHYRGFLTYLLDGDNVRHGLNKDLSFKPEDRAENIRRMGEVAKLFADAGVICIASLISPYRKDRDACRALMSDGSFVEVFMNMPLEVCEARDPKGLYKLARAGKIAGFTGIDDPYEAPMNCEVIIEQKDDSCPSPTAMAKLVLSYLEERGYLKA